MMKIRRFFYLGLLFPVLAVAAELAPEPAAVPAKPAEEVKPVVAEPAVDIPSITNLKDIAKALKLKAFKDRKFTRKLKVAVLDNGFNGYQGEIGKSLPAGTQYHAGKSSRADDIADPSYHGLMMAQILAGVIKESGAAADYELHLFNAYGYTKFADSIDTVVRDQFDLVLYSQVWEYGGNGDGKGFIDVLVDKAIAAGVIWINAAGNFGHLTKVAPVDGKAEGTDEFVAFAGKKAEGFVTIVCKTEPKQQCPLRLVLAWNDFKDDAEAGTDKDLDLILQDDKGKELTVSDRNQGLTANDADPKSSKIPRELIETNVAPGTYRVRVKIKSKNFSASQDQLRITASGRGIEMNAASVGETLLPPADNAGVIVVGAADDFQTNTSKKLSRPEVYVNSLVKLSDGSMPYSTSNAAAMIAGLSVLEIGTGTEKARDPLIAKLKSVNVKAQKNPPAAPLIAEGPQEAPKARRQKSAAQPAYTDDGTYGGVYRTQPYRGEPAPQEPRAQQRPQCLRGARLASNYPALRWILNEGGGQAVVVRGLPSILINYTSACFQDICPQPGEQLVLTPDGPDVVAKSDLGYLPRGYYPIIMRDLPVCR